MIVSTMNRAVTVFTISFDHSKRTKIFSQNCTTKRTKTTNTTCKDRYNRKQKEYLRCCRYLNNGLINIRIKDNFKETASNNVTLFTFSTETTEDEHVRKQPKSLYPRRRSLHILRTTRGGA